MEWPNRGNIHDSDAEDGRGLNTYQHRSTMYADGFTERGKQGRVMEERGTAPREGQRTYLYVENRGVGLVPRPA